MKRIIVVFTIFILVLNISSCSSQSINDLNERITSLEKQLENYQKKNSELSSEIERLRIELSENQALLEEKPIMMERIGGICYIGVESDEIIRFVSNDIDLRALPFNDSPRINVVQKNTLIHVNDKVSNTGNYDDIETLWYYVSIPVYDTPMDYKGWVKCKETEPYNESTQQLLQSDVRIRIGAKYSVQSELPDFYNESQLLTCTEDIGGRIEKRQGDYVYIFGTGGSAYWVHKKDVVYPDIP